MKVAAVLLGCCLVLAACSSSSTGEAERSDVASALPTSPTTEPEVVVGGPAAACAAAVEFDHVLYIGHAADRNPAPGEALGTGTVPGCNDTGEETDPPATPMQLWAIEGVDPSIAVTDANGGLWIAERFEGIPAELEYLFNG